MSNSRTRKLQVNKLKRTLAKKPGKSPLKPTSANLRGLKNVHSMRMRKNKSAKGKKTRRKSSKTIKQH